jgi:NADH-quinone oxidoreductase E subunit
VNTHGNGPPAEQLEHFEFTAENRERVKVHLAKYPQGRQQSAVLPLLDLAQRQSDGWLPVAAMNHVADLLQMPRIRVYEVATFYTMFNLRPIGRWLLQACTTTPCWLRGSADVVNACRKQIHARPHTLSADGKFSWMEVECLGACVNAPMMQIGKDFYEDLDGPATERIIEAFRRGETPKPGSQIGRHTSEPIGGATTLTARSAERGGKDAGG